jgi:hypothetical protein
VTLCEILAAAVEESTETQAEDEEEEDDPLDAFMAGIDTQVKKEAEMPSEEKVRTPIYQVVLYDTRSGEQYAYTYIPCVC